MPINKVLYTPHIQCNVVLRSGGRVTVDRSDVSHEDIRPGSRCGFRPRVSATGSPGAVRRAFKAMDSIGVRVSARW